MLEELGAYFFDNWHTAPPIDGLSCLQIVAQMAYNCLCAIKLYLPLKLPTPAMTVAVEAP